MIPVLSMATVMHTLDLGGGWQVSGEPVSTKFVSFTRPKHMKLRDPAITTTVQLPVTCVPV